MATRGGFLVGDRNIVRPRHPMRYVASKQTKSTKRKKKKPEWDSTVNDLNVHKATKEEQIKRHETHKSKNASRVHLQSKVKDRSLDSTIQTPDTLERRKLAIVQEVLYGQDKFQDVLSESDKAMSVVKDLFGDDPKKFMGFPNITAAPGNLLHGKENKYAVGPVAEMPETPTHLSLLSDSVMRTPALNELPDDDKEDEEFSPGTPPPGQERGTTSSFQPMLDLQRFQQYVAQEQSKYVEHNTAPLLNGRGTDHVPPYSGIATGQATVPSTVGTKIIGEESGPFFVGRGVDHVVAPHGSSAIGQATFPSTVGAEMNDEGSRLIQDGHGPDHVAPQSGMAVTTGHSQPPSFLSQESADTVIAGGPNFVKPVSIGEPTTNSSIPSNVRMPSSRVETDQQDSGKAKTKTKTSHKPPTNSSSSGLRSLDDLKKMVEELETEVAAYEYETGRQQTKLSSPSMAGSFSGYTASLITAVTKLMGYLKESEIQRKAEMVMREQVLQGFEEQRALVDALTNDILHTQEQNLALQYELLEYRKTTDEQLQYLKRELSAVLRSHEYQALSSSINTLYSLNPVALKKEAFDALNPTQHENQSLEYLPGAPVPQAHRNQEQERIGNSTGRDFTEDTKNKPSFIPLATFEDQTVSQYSALNRMTTSSQVSQADNQPIKSSNAGQPHTQISTEDYTKPPHSVAAPTAASVHQLLHNGHVPLVYPNSGLASANYGMPGHGQISSNIVMYPPSQVHFTQAGDRGATTVRPQMSAPGVPGIPAVQSEPVPPGFRVVHTGPPIASPLYSPHRQTPGQSGSNVQMQVQSGQPAVLNTMQPMPSVPQGNPQPHQPASLSLSQEIPPTVSQEDPRLASATHSKKSESTRQAGAVVTSGEASDLLHGQQQPSWQFHAQPAPKMEQASKSRGFAPVSRAMIGAIPANHQLRERLQNLANRQKTLTAKSGEQDVGSVQQKKGEGRGVAVHQPRPTSPHVHFQDPPVLVNGQDTGKQQHSPPVSPIPYKNPQVLRSTAPPEKRVVVNLPNAWSDVSSTISL
ncbi:uncharacterized protein LOC144639223 isoform X2 [Oculina patagonica]